MPDNEDELSYIRDGIKAMIAAASKFDEKAKAIEVAMKFEALRIKSKAAKKGGFGKGFEGGDDDI